MAPPMERRKTNEEREKEQNERRSKNFYDLRKMFADPKTNKMMTQMLPRQFTAERMTRLSILAAQKTPKLLDCSPAQLLGAFLGCSALGLEPNSPAQHIHLIPFWDSTAGEMSLQVITGYRGYMELGRRTGQIMEIHADVAMTNDEFVHEFGTEVKLKHVMLLTGEDRGDPRAAYCYVRLKDGQIFSVVPWVDVLKIRDRSANYARASNKANTVWGQHLIRMGRKTGIRQLFSGGEAPQSIEIQGALAIDDRRVDFAQLAQAPLEQIKEDLPSFVDDDDYSGYGEDDEVDGDGVVTERKGEPAEQQTAKTSAAIEDRREPPMEAVRTDQRDEREPAQQAQDHGEPQGKSGGIPSARGRQPASASADAGALFGRRPNR